MATGSVATVLIPAAPIAQSIATDIDRARKSTATGGASIGSRMMKPI